MCNRDVSLGQLLVGLKLVQRGERGGRQGRWRGGPGLLGLHGHLEDGRELGRLLGESRLEFGVEVLLRSWDVRGDVAVDGVLDDYLHSLDSLVGFQGRVLLVTGGSDDVNDSLELFDVPLVTSVVKVVAVEFALFNVESEVGDLVV